MGHGKQHSSPAGYLQDFEIKGFSEISGGAAMPPCRRSGEAETAEALLELRHLAAPVHQAVLAGPVWCNRTSACYAFHSGIGCRWFVG